MPALQRKLETALSSRRPYFSREKFEGAGAASAETKLGLPDFTPGISRYSGREGWVPRHLPHSRRWASYLVLRSDRTNGCKTRKKDQDGLLNVLQGVRQILDNSTLIKECL